MIYAYPSLQQADHAVIALIDRLKDQLKYQVNANPLRWQGFLRRNTFARALQGSNSIEGYNASLSDAVAIVDDERPDSLEEETTRALVGYRTAMTYIVRAYNDEQTDVNAQFIRSLHFMMLNYDLTKLPGQWRPSSVFVVHEPTGETVYEGPQPEAIPELIAELVAQIHDATGGKLPIVTAAMAHLNLAMIHPFKDGNGRMARALQTLVLARDGVVGPVFSSIEEWLGRNTDAYYKVLAETGLGCWNPSRDALPWVRFCLVAHYQQAVTLMKRNAEIGRVWNEVSRLRISFALPERCETIIMDACFGYKVRNAHYREENKISDVVAGRDLKRLADAGLLEPIGEKRGRHYVATDVLKTIRQKCVDKAKAANPYDLVAAGEDAKQLRLTI